MPAVREHVTPKYYVDQASFYHVDEPSLFRLYPDEKLDDFIVLNSSLALTKTIIKLPTKSYVDSLHESSRNRRDLSSVFNDQDNEFHNIKLTNLDSVSVNRNPSSDNELANKKYIDDELDKNAVLRFNQTLQNYFKVSVGDDTILLNMIKYKLLIQRILRQVALDYLFYPIGKLFVMIRTITVKCQISLKQQKQTSQQVILEQSHYLLSVIVF